MTRIQDGIYLESSAATLGVGDTAQRTTLESFWRARQINDDTVRLELLDMDDRLTGIVEEVELEDFQSRFVFQPDYLEKCEQRRKNQRVNKIVALAERHYQDREFLSAEFEYNNALKIDEQNVRANFGLGMTYVEQGETDKARDVFQNLAGIDAMFEEENKHLFNEFGISLRKLGLYSEAIRHYQKALSIVDDDENLYYNLGRAYFEKGDRPNAVKWLGQALTVNPDFAEGRKYLAFIQQQKD
jgi:tetratricopeptide (TPR) repeat protein